MKVICVLLTLYFSTEIYGQVTDINSTRTLTLGNNESFKPSSTADYYYDPQIPGFNSTNMTSGPIVLADKRTLFISNIQYQGPEITLLFYVGIGSPYNAERQLVAEENFLGNHTNMYITLPENLTLDNIDFIVVSDKNSLELLDYVILEKINRSSVKDYQEGTMADVIYRIPKCCQHNKYLTYTNGCVEIDAEEQINLNINIFESNETGLDPDIILDPTNYKLRPYVQGLKCNDNEYKLQIEDEIYGLIYNTSLIIQGSGILSHGEYCFEGIKDNGNYTTSALYCYPIPIDNSDPNLYLPVLIISTICFALSAAAYGIILKAKDISKICFIAFSCSMCLTFLSLIILQIQSNVTTCGIFGFIFIFSTILSFLWLLILCLELLYSVRFPIKTQRNDNRWLWYIAASCGLAALLCFISMFSGKLWIPDVPNSFIKSYGSDKCEFETTLSRTFIVFVPMILSIVLSIACLIILRSFMNKNEKNEEIKNHIDWVENKNEYNFSSRTYIIIILVSSFWLLNLFLYSYELGSSKTQLALDIIEAALGIVTLIAFVLNKYTLAEIKERRPRKKKTVPEEVRLNGIPTPDPVDNNLEESSFPYRDTNLTSFRNNR